MDFAQTTAQHALQERAREAVRTVVAPVAAAVPRGAKLTGDQMRTIFRGLAPLGYLGSTIPKDLGGAGMSCVERTQTIVAVRTS